MAPGARRAAAIRSTWRAAKAGEMAYPYFKLAVWDGISMTFRDGKLAFPTQERAKMAALKPGKYRLSEVSEAGRRDFEAFEV